MPTLEELLAASEAQSQGAGSVTTAAPSPLGTDPAVTPGSTPNGVPSPDSLEGMLAASESESQKPISQAAAGKPAWANYTGGVNGRLADAVHSAYWFMKNNNPAAQAADVFQSGKALVTGEKRGPGIAERTFGNSPEEQQSREGFKQFLHDNLGMSVTHDADSTMGHIGENTVDALMSLGGFMSQAPKLAATAGYSTMDYLKRSFGKALVEHPWLAMVSDVVGGVPGSTIGGEQLGPGGAIVGGVAGNVATAIPQMAGRTALAAGRTLARQAVEAVDTLASKFGIQNPPIEALGMKGKVPTVPDDILDTYRQAEGKARASGDAVVQAAQDLRDLRREGADSKTVFEATHRLWALKQDEKTAAATAEQGWLAIPKAARGKYTQEATAIRDEFADTNYPRQFAEDQVAGERKIVENRIQSALDEIRPDKNLTSEQYAARVSQGIDDAHTLATKIEQRYWKRVDILDERMPSRATVQGDIDLFVNDRKSRFADSDIPYDQIKGFRQLFAAKGNGENLFQSLPTVRRLRGEISALDGTRRKELASDAPNNRLIANLTGLEAMANKWIDDAFPNSIPLKQARAFSSMKADLFYKSEMFPFLAQGARGQDRVRPEDAINRLLSRPRAMEDLYNTVDTLLRAKRLPKQADAYPTALSFKQQAPLDQLRSDVENGIRQSFREEVAKQDSNPLSVQKTVDKWQPRIKEFSRVAGEMQVAMTKALKGVDERNAIEKSALAKYFETDDPEIAVKKVWSHPNASRVARSLISGEAGLGGFAKDPIALEGFRSSMVDKLLNTGQMQPKRINELLADPRINRLMTTVLGNDRVSRLENVVQRAIQSETDTNNSSYMRAAVWGARLAAVKVSALLPHIGKGGELQQAALFSEIAKAKVTSMFSGNPSNLVIEAIRNPSMERLLNKSTPITKWGTSKELKSDLLLMRRVLRMDIGLRGAYEGVMGREPDKRPEKHSEIIPDSRFETASVQPTMPTKGQDFNESARVITQDATRNYIQGPANRQGNPFQPSPGVPITPGRYHIPSNKGLSHPWNTVI